MRVDLTRGVRLAAKWPQSGRKRRRGSRPDVGRGHRRAGAMSDNPFRLDGKPAIVVGAALGIGRAIALAFASAGAKVACLDIDEAAARDTAARIGKASGTAMAHRCDVTSEVSIAD